MNNRRRIVLFPLFIIGAIVFVILFGWLVMALWNSVLVPVLNVNAITYWQALGLLVLSRILVGGFSGGSRGRNSDWYWKRKWMRMSSEEKAQFREKWRQRFGSDFFNEQKSQGSTESTQ